MERKNEARDDCLERRKKSGLKKGRGRDKDGRKEKGEKEMGRKKENTLQQN